MAEVINTNAVFDSTKKFVDFEGLDYFWGQAKKHIDDADAALSDRLDGAEGDISDLKGKVGDDNSGLIKDVASLKADVEALGGAEGGIQGMIDASIEALDLANTYDAKGAADDALDAAKEYADDAVEAAVGVYSSEGVAASGLRKEIEDKTSVNAGAISGLAERVASLEGIEKAADVVYGTDKHIYLVDAEGNKIGDGFDASDFVVDGMLDSVDFETVEVENEDGSKTEVKTNNLVFTFNTASGKEEVKVDFTKYVDTYHADNSSIALDSATNTFSVKNVDAAKTTLSTDIQIAGGPLANDVEGTDDVWPTGWTKDGVKIIPQGKSLEEILTALFLKVVEGTVAWNSVSDINNTWTPSIGNISATLKNGTTSLTSTSDANKATVVEVGTPLTVSALTAGTVSKGTRTATCTCSEGYFTTNEVDDNGKPVGEWKSGNLVLTKNGTLTDDSEASLACKWNNNATDVTLNSTELVVVEGTNTLNVSQSGQTVTIEAFPSTTVWAATNTKSLLSASATLTDTKPSDKELTKSNDFKAVGKYKYFLGYSNNTLYSQFDSASVRALTTKSNWITVDGTTTIVNDTAIKSNGKSIVIACPNKYKLASVNNGVGANILENFTTKGSEGTVDVATGDVTTVYRVYVYPITNNAEVEFKNVTLTKA